MKDDMNYTPYEEYDQVENLPVPTAERKISTLERTENILTLVRQNTEIINRGFDLASQITDVYSESQRLNAQVAITQEMSKVQMAKIAAKYMATRDVIEHTFAERGTALSKFYHALDHAIESDNQELILAAMHNISSIVTTSPLEDIQSFCARYNDTSQQLLDW